MTKGISLHIGLNYVDPNHYSGWDGELVAAENDANDMYLISKSQGLQATKLLRQEATREAIIGAITTATQNLSNGDLFVFTFSGHGGQLPDGNSDEADGLDETLCMFDGELVDDELSQLWSKFQEGIRVLMIADSCHSGTAARLARMAERPKSEFNPKFMPRDIALSTYLNNKELYDKILEGTKNVDSDTIQASVKLISGCQDNQSSYDGAFNGQFTGMLKHIWNGGKFNGNYLSFYKKILNAMPPEQTPNYYNIGQPNEPFENQKPFTI